MRASRPTERRSGARSSGVGSSGSGSSGADSPRRRQSDRPSFGQLLASREVVIFAGSGGVGKTTLAAAAALYAVTDLGGRVLVITVDPARRLADALGLGGLGNVETRVGPESFEKAGLGVPRGELWAAQLDTKRSWDDLVLRHAGDEATAYRILDNRLYQNLTARFVQSHDYIAMERLYELHSSGGYDLVVVDTPPTRNAIDFLEAPARMQEFFGGRLIRIFTAPYRFGGGLGARAINLAARPFYRVADQILGSRFLEEIAEFFTNFHTMYEGFTERAHDVQRLLRDRRTAFVVVTTLESTALAEGEAFCQRLGEMGLPLGALVLNRVLPHFLSNPGAARLARALADEGIRERLAERLSKQVGGATVDPDLVKGVLTTLGENFMNFRSLATLQESEMLRLTRGPPGTLITVPSFETDIHDLAGLAEVSQALAG
jgi:anion-transporting  ArsA/GET3 family ATPase